MTPEEIKFLRDTANLLKKEDARTLLEYGDVHNRAYGNIVDVAQGGITFQEENALPGATDFVPWSRIDKMARRPLAATSVEETKRRSAGAR